MPPDNLLERHLAAVVRGLLDRIDQAMQLNRGLLPFQVGASAQAQDYRQGESEEWCFHFLE